MDDHQEEVLETMAEALVLFSRLMTGIALVASASTMLFGSSFGLSLWKASCLMHGLAILCNACAHTFLKGDRKVVLETRWLAGLNAAVLITIAVKFA